MAKGNRSEKEWAENFRPNIVAISCNGEGKPKRKGVRDEVGASINAPTSCNAEAMPKAKKTQFGLERDKIHNCGFCPAESQGPQGFVVCQAGQIVQLHDVSRLGKAKKTQIIGKEK